VKANPNVYSSIKEERDMACEALRELFKPELEEAIEHGNRMIYSLVQDGDITPKLGAEKLGISLKQLKANMTNTGFTYPKKAR
jgi:hypothetical protein